MDRVRMGSLQSGAPMDKWPMTRCLRAVTLEIKPSAVLDDTGHPTCPARSQTQLLYGFLSLATQKGQLFKV